MTLINMCNNCPHNPMKHEVIGGAEVVPDWMQYVKDTFWNKPDLLEPPLWLTDTLDKTQTIFPELKNILQLRNRIFHHESISWNLEVLESYKQDIIEGINWLDKYLLIWIDELNHVDQIIEKYRKAIE